jgi:hypothetical protein
MRRSPLLFGLLIFTAGCNGNGNEGDPKDAPLVFEAVLKTELSGTKKGDGWYVFVDGVDPAPDALVLFQKNWAELQPGSKAPKGKANRVSISELKWIDRDTAELRGGFSNGMDGRGSRYRVVRKKGAWVVENAVVEVQS